MNIWRIVRDLVLAVSMYLALTACYTSPEDDAPKTEDSATSPITSLGWDKGAMIAAADPRAVEAGLSVLKSGGNAIDAAIAAHAVLGLVEPQSSGIGGGAFMVVYDAVTQQTHVVDGRETAPATATPDWFMRDGMPLGFVEAWQSGRSIGVPGQIALYEMAHKEWGALDWSSLFIPAINLAEQGWRVSPRVASAIGSERLRRYIRLDEEANAKAYFYPDGMPLAARAIVKNQPYADTLRRISEEGARAFYSGEIAEAIIEAANAPPLASKMTLADLENYRPVMREALCAPWRIYKICSAPPPSSGGITQPLILNLYDRIVEARGGRTNLSQNALIQAWIDAQRLAYADRDHYVADADQIMVPTGLLLDPAYWDLRAKQAFAPGAAAQPGDPGLIINKPIIDMWGRDNTNDQPGTTHLSVIDKYGNVVAMTATIEASFGASRMVNGFLLNNELTDFAFNPDKNGKSVANAVAPGKRPRSSMSPTIVFDDDGMPIFVTGSPGGNSIIAYVSKSIIGVLDWKLSVDEALALPNIIARGNRVGVETTAIGGAEIATYLKNLGYEVVPGRGEQSGLNAIHVTDAGLEGGSDTRREGMALGITETTE